jgi:ABC-type branched-subunit amino acid transport system ATPase component
VILSVRDKRRERLRDVLFRPGTTASREEELRTQATTLLRSVGLEDLLRSPAEHLSYGQRKLVSILACVAAGAGLLLLDEPVAGVAPDLRDKILSLIRSLRNEGKSVLLIEHDFDAVSSVCDRVVFMDLGQIRGEGTPDQIRKNPTVIEAYLS